MIVQEAARRLRPVRLKVEWEASADASDGLAVAAEAAVAAADRNAHASNPAIMDASGSGSKSSASSESRNDELRHTPTLRWGNLCSNVLCVAR